MLNNFYTHALLTELYMSTQESKEGKFFESMLCIQKQPERVQTVGKMYCTLRYKLKVTFLDSPYPNLKYWFSFANDNVILTTLEKDLQATLD